MTTETTTPDTAAAATDLTAILARIEALEKPAAAAAPPVAPEVLATKEMDAAAFAAYTAEQVAAATAETAELAKARLDHLAKNAVAVKQFYADGQPPMVTVYKDPGQTLPTTTTPALPVDTRSDGVALDKSAPAIKVAKMLGALALELQKNTEVRTEVAKSARITVAKAGEAAAMLAKVAAMFGVDMSDPEMKGYSLRWKISDAVEVLQQAAQLETTLATLSATLGSGAAAPAEAAKSAESVTKSAVEGDWPRDMNSTDLLANGSRVERPMGWGQTER